MGVVTYSQEITSVVAPSRLFKALVLDNHNILPKVVPEGIKSIELIQGDGGVGSIKQTNFGEKAPLKYMKHRMDALDADNLYCKYTMIESDNKSDKIEFVVEEVKFVTAGSGCISKETREFHVKEGCELKEEDIKMGKEKAMELFKAVEKYLVDHPDVYA